MQVAVPSGAPNPVQDTSLLLTDQARDRSPTVSTWSGAPGLHDHEDDEPELRDDAPSGDPITYTMAVAEHRHGQRDERRRQRPVPAQTSYVSCTGGGSCSNSAGPSPGTSARLRRAIGRRSRDRRDERRTSRSPTRSTRSRTPPASPRPRSAVRARATPSRTLRCMPTVVKSRLGDGSGQRRHGSPTRCRLEPRRRIHGRRQRHRSRPAPRSP